MTDYHIPALLHDSVDGLNVKEEGVYVDVTFGGGGHSREILRRLGPNGRLIAFDQDEDAFRNSIDDSRFTLVRSNFRYLKNFLRYHDALPVDGILADLGVSFHHFDSEQRGFSFRFDGDLDMRMNQSSSVTAASVLNTYDVAKLSSVLYKYGELRNDSKIASAIVKARAEQPIQTIAQFLEVMKPFVKREKEKKTLSQAFQALRIEVNNEMDALCEMLSQSLKVLAPGGRLSVISYHSLEDRLVKNFMKSGNFDGDIQKDFFGNVLSPFEIVTRKAIVPTAEEIERNPRSRSAKLRIVEKKNEVEQ